MKYILETNDLKLVYAIKKMGLELEPVKIYSDEIEKLKEFARSEDWKSLQFLSSKDFKKKYHDWFIKYLGYVPSRCDIISAIHDEGVDVMANCMIKRDGKTFRVTKFG